VLQKSYRRLVVLLAVVLAVLLSSVPSAVAISAPIHITNTGGEGVFIRPQPDTSQPPVGWMPEGASPDYNCFAWGQNINGVPIWFSVNYSGKTGYYASYFDDSSYHSNEELTAKYGVPLCGSAAPAPAPAPTPAPAPAPAPAPSPGAAPSSGLVFTIVDADGGVYYRRSPDWSDTARTPGVGVYSGDRVELICGALGTSVGPYNNRAWSKVRNLSRNVGEGWVNEHFINDGAAANAFVAGEPMCGGSSGGSGSGSGTASLYFSPFSTNPHGPNTTGDIEGNNPLHVGINWVSAPSPATVTMNREEWDKNHDAKGCPALDSFAPDQSWAYDSGQITTLAGWSASRSAPLLLLRYNPEMKMRVQYILLFDPGTDDEWKSSACAKEYPIATILREWLIAGKNNKLVILSGVKTADAGHTSVDGHGHAGIQNALFVPLKKAGEPSGRNLRSQIVVCNYDSKSHPDVWIDFRSWINKPAITLGNCPSDPDTGKRPVSWNP